MANLIQCPSCKQQYTLQASLAGKQVTCNNCGNPFHVPGPTMPAARPQRAPITQSSSQPTRRTLEPTPTELRMLRAGVYLDLFNYLIFFWQLDEGIPPGVCTTSLCVLLTLVAMALIVPRYRHEPRKALGVVVGNILVTVLVIGTAHALVRIGDKWPPVAAPLGGDRSNGRPPGSVGPNEPPLSGFPITLWDVKAKGNRVFGLEFTAEYRIDQPESLDAGLEFWVVENEAGRIEATLLWNKSRPRGRLMARGLGPAEGMLLSDDFVKGPWTSHLEDGLSALDRRPISNSAPVESIADVNADASTQVDHEAIERRQEERRQAMIEEYGLEKTVTLRLEGVPTEGYAFATERIKEVVGNPPIYKSTSGVGLSYLVAPCTDLEGLAAQLDLGEAVEINSALRSVTIKIDEAKFPSEIRTLPTAPEEPDFVERNLAALDSPSLNRKQAALTNLKNANPKQPRADVVETLVPMLKDDSSSIRVAAVEAIAVWAAEDIALRILTELLQSEEQSYVIGSAATALAKQKSEAAAEIVAGCFPSDPYGVARGLKEMGPVARRAVVPYLDHEDLAVRSQALGVCKVIGVAPEAVGAFLEMLANGDHASRLAALEALGKTGDPRSAEPVAELLADPSLKYQAAACLKSMGPVAENDVVKLMTHEDAAIRRDVVRLLDEIGTEKSIPALIEALDDEDLQVRTSVFTTLENSDDPRVIEVMAGQLLEQQHYRAAVYLKKIGPAAEDAVREQLQTEEKSVLIECLGILKEIGTKESITDLRRYIRNRDTGIRSAAQQALDAILARRKAAQSEG